MPHDFGSYLDPAYEEFNRRLNSDLLHLLLEGTEYLSDGMRYHPTAKKNKDNGTYSVIIEYAPWVLTESSGELKGFNGFPYRHTGDDDGIIFDNVKAGNPFSAVMALGDALQEYFDSYKKFNIYVPSGWL